MGPGGTCRRAISSGTVFGRNAAEEVNSMRPQALILGIFLSCLDVGSPRSEALGQVPAPAPAPAENVLLGVSGEAFVLNRQACVRVKRVVPGSAATRLKR